MTTTATAGITLSVYSNPRYRGCTNGPTRTLDDLTLVGHIDRAADPAAKVVTPLPDHAQVFEPTAASPAVAMVLRQIGDPVIHLEPVEWDAERGVYAQEPSWYMAGGNFAGTTDSRVNDLAQTLTGRRSYGALSVHDRREW